MGGVGDDTLSGGAGDDAFTFTNGDGADTIQDFTAGAATDYGAMGKLWSFAAV